MNACRKSAHIRNQAAFPKLIIRNDRDSDIGAWSLFYVHSHFSTLHRIFYFVHPSPPMHCVLMHTHHAKYLMSIVPPNDIPRLKSFGQINMLCWLVPALLWYLHVRCGFVRHDLFKFISFRSSICLGRAGGISRILITISISEKNLGPFISASVIFWRICFRTVCWMHHHSFWGGLSLH